MSRDSALSFTQRQEEPIADISYPWLDHASLITVCIESSAPDLGALTPFLCRPPHAVRTTQNTDDNDLLHAPLFQCLYCCCCGPTGRNDGVDKNGQLCGCGIARYLRCWSLEGEVVVVFDWLEGGRLAKEAEVGDGDWFGKDGL